MFKKLCTIQAAAFFLFAVINPSYAELLSLRVSSDSMMPMLGLGDNIATTSYQPDEKIKRGDLVVYLRFDPKSTTNQNKRRNDAVFVGRIIGMPGETVQVKDGIPYINGVPFEADALSDTIEDGCPKETIPNQKCRFMRETQPEGINYVVLDLVDNSPGDNVSAKETTADEYYIMGDNRDNSNDSRFSEAGLVSKDRIKGKLRMIWATVRAPDRNERLQGFPNLK